MSQVRQKREARKGLWVTPPNRHFVISSVNCETTHVSGLIVILINLNW